MQDRHDGDPPPSAVCVPSSSSASSRKTTTRSLPRPIALDPSIHPSHHQPNDRLEAHCSLPNLPPPLHTTTMLLRSALLLLLVASPGPVEAFSSAARSSPSNTNKGKADGEWIAQTFELDSSVVQGPGHVLMYDTTLRGE